MQDNDFKWFLDNYEDLYNKYGNTFLAIKNGNVLGTYNTYADGVRETAKKEELGTFIVQRCDGTKDKNMNYIASMNVVLV